MSLEPSQPLAEQSHSKSWQWYNPPLEPPKKPLKPGKTHGIIALLCGAEGFLAILAVILYHLLISLGVPSGILNAWGIIATGLFLINPFCVIAGIVFGNLGRGSQGQFYGNIGFVLSLLCGATVSPCAVLGAISMLVPCC